MPFADAIPDKLTDEMVRHHQVYVDALAEHNIACADRSRTVEERAQLALKAVHLWRAFAEACGVPIPRAAAPTERSYKGEFCKLLDAAEAAHAVLRAVEAGDLLSALPASEYDTAQHNVGVRLVCIAQDSLRAAIAEAERA